MFITMSHPLPLYTAEDLQRLGELSTVKRAMREASLCWSSPCPECSCTSSALSSFGLLPDAEAAPLMSKPEVDRRALEVVRKCNLDRDIDVAARRYAEARHCIAFCSDLQLAPLSLCLRTVLSLEASQPASALTAVESAPTPPCVADARFGLHFLSVLLVLRRCRNRLALLRFWRGSGCCCSGDTHGTATRTTRPARALLFLTPLLCSCWFRFSRVWAATHRTGRGRGCC